MVYLVRCECGVEIRDADQAELIARVKEHARTQHQLEFTEDQVLALVEIEVEEEPAS
ncbi:MAG TPA: DUF1059 domain-containing protein [Thermomicrobiales bacterium]|nr:DUF1059 domain-containing protein [Thermomicrobiales bacterium]